MAAPGAQPLIVDARLLKFSQACVVVVAALAFLLNAPWLAAVGALCLAVSALAPGASPFRLLYRRVLVPLRLLRTRPVEDDPAPHRFAQGVGAVFMTAGALALLVGHLAVLGWTLDLIVFALAGLNFSVGFCAGCFVYYQLGRLRLVPRVRYDGGFRWRGA